MSKRFTVTLMIIPKKPLMIYVKSLSVDHFDHYILLTKSTRRADTQAENLPLNDILSDGYFLYRGYGGGWCLWGITDGW